MTPVTVTLRPVRRDNITAECRLRVADQQADSVATNARSIAEAYVEPTFRPFGIYADDELVGLMMYGFDVRVGRWWVVRLMIDARYQGQGYGRQAMEVPLPMMIAQEGMESIVTSFVPGNDVAARLDRSLGFEDTGEVEENEPVLRYVVRS